LAAPVIPPGGRVPDDCALFRALNPKHYEDGLPGDNHFVMEQSHPQDDGVSMAITELITLEQFRGLSSLTSRYGEAFGVAELNVGEILEPVQSTWISVRQKDDPLWGDCVSAHAIVTGYQMLTGASGKKRILEFQRHLVQLARKNFHPPVPPPPPVAPQV